MTALNRAGWRPEMNVAGGADDNVTFTGNRALMLEEPLIFEIGSNGTTGVDFDEAAPASDLGGLARREGRRRGERYRVEGARRRRDRGPSARPLERGPRRRRAR